MSNQHLAQRAWEGPGESKPQTTTHHPMLPTPTVQLNLESTKVWGYFLKILFIYF